MLASRIVTHNDKRVLLGMAATIGVLMILGWGTFVALVLPGHYTLANDALFGMGLAFTAFTLGIRHAFDADHIAAIDNTTRKLVEDGQHPVSVGFWFALGHSTVVVAAVALLTAGLNVLADRLLGGDAGFASVAGVWSILISGGFLLLIGALNLASLGGIWSVYREMKAGHFDEARLEAQLRNRGGLYRLLGPVARRVDAPWKMYPVGLLFGLGFDTATTIALFVIGGSTVLTAPWYVVLVLPILFTAGMTLFDSLDGIFMSRAYRWAYARPLRKVRYNLTVTVISIAAAFLVGGLGLIRLLIETLDARGEGLPAWIASIDLENFGFYIVAAFLVTWLGALAYWKLGNIEDRYSNSGTG